MQRACWDLKAMWVAFRPDPTAPSGLTQQCLQPLGSGAVREIRKPLQELTRISRTQGLAEQETLRLVTLVLLQEQQLRQVLDAFGRNVDPQRPGHGDDGRGNGAIIAAVIDGGDEGSIDLQAIDG